MQIVCIIPPMLYTASTFGTPRMNIGANSEAKQYIFKLENFQKRAVKLISREQKRTAGQAFALNGLSVGQTFCSAGNNLVLSDSIELLDKRIGQRPFRLSAFASKSSGRHTYRSQEAKPASVRFSPRIQFLQQNEGGTYAAMANMISGKKYYGARFIFERSGSDSLGGGCPIFYLGVTRGATFCNQIPP